MFDLNILGWTLLLSIVLNFIFFIIAYLIKTDKFTDITYSLTFLLINIFLLIFNIKTIGILQILILSLIWVWAIRLGTYLLVRIFKIKKDKRFDNIRTNFFKFFMFWIMQALTAYIISIPTIIFVSLTINFGDKNFNYLGILLFIPCFFLVYETIADIQKYNYYLNRATPFLNSGLYKISRFPNYFGEISFWLSICIFEISILFLSVGFNAQYLYLLFALLSPLFLIITIFFISGISLLDISNIKKFKDNQEYLNYVKSTSMLFPLFGKKGFSLVAVKHLKKDI